MDDLVNYTTGEIFKTPRMYRNRQKTFVEQRCTNNSCPTCCVLNARRLVGALMLAVPTHSFSVTLVGSTAAEVSDNMKHFMNFMRLSDDTLEYVWVAEPNPGMTGSHVHGFLYCSSGIIKESQLTDASSRSGLGRSKLKTVSPDSNASHFAYLFKCLANSEVRDQFLDLNSSSSRRRLIHASRASSGLSNPSRTGFWRDGVGGRGLTQDAAIQLSYKRSQEDQ
jgi:hypothetical protein